MRATGTPELPRRSLVRNALAAIGGTSCYHICQLAVVALLNKYASPELAGEYFLGYAIALPVVLFFGLELRGALIADASGQFTFGTYRVLRLVTLVPAAALLIGFLAYRGAQGESLVGLGIIGGVFLARLAWAGAEFGWGALQRRERLDIVAAAYALRGLALLLPFAVLLITATGMYGRGARQVGNAAAVAALLHAVGFLAVYYLFDRPRVLTDQHDQRWTWPAVRALGWQTLPLGMVALAVNLCDSFPRWLFERPGVADGTAQLGYFGSLAYITQAGNLLVLQTVAAAANRLAVYYQRDLRRFLRLLLTLCGVAGGLGVTILVLVFFFGRWLLKVLYTPEYLQFETEFRLIVLAHSVALLTNVLGSATTQMRVFWIQVPVQALTLGATIVAAVLLIPGPTPVRGGAYTALIRSGVQLVLYVGCVAWGLSTRPRQLARVQGAPPPKPTA